MENINLSIFPFQQASREFVDNLASSVSQVSRDLRDLNLGDMIPSSVSTSEDSSEGAETSRPKEEQDIIDDVQVALESLHQALEHVEPNKSPEEISEMLRQYDRHTFKIVDDLLRKISKEKDRVIVHEWIMQAKVQLYEDWARDVIDHAEISFPEASKCLKEMKKAHEVLFERYPGKGDFSEVTLTEAAVPQHEEVDAATYLQQASLKPNNRPVFKEMAIGSALKKQHEDIAVFLKIKKFFQTFVPITKWLPNYERKNLQGDLVAGLTSGIFVIPQAMAYSLLIGIPPKYGLYSAFIPAIIYAFMGGCGQIAYGPVAMLSLLLNSALQQFPNASDSDKVAICIFLSLMIGFTELLMGVLKFGFITTFLSQPVLSGFTSAAALIIIISQLKLMFGVAAASSSYPVVSLYYTIAALGGFRWGSFLLSMASIIFLLIVKFYVVTIPKTKIPFPGAMVIVVFGIILMSQAPELNSSIDTVGFIPPGLPTPQYPITSFVVQNFGTLAINFLVMALLAFLEKITVGKLYSSKNGYTVDPNGELIAGGLSNIVGSFFSCFPVTGGFGRSPVNASAGAKTQVTGLLSSIVVAIVLVCLTSVFSYLPKAILAAIIFVAVLALFDTDQAKFLWRVNKSEFTLMLITFVMTLGIGPQYGIFISIALSLLLVLFKSSRPGFAILGRLPGTAVYRSIVDFPEAICIPGIMLFQFHSPIYFMNATYLKRKLMYTESLLSKGHTKTWVIILDAQAITSIDSVGMTVLREILEAYTARDIVIIFASLTGRAEEALLRAGLKEQIGENHFFPRLHDAIQAALRNEVEVHRPPPPPPKEKKPSIPAVLLQKFVSTVKRKKNRNSDSSSDESERVVAGGGEEMMDDEMDGDAVSLEVSGGN